MRIKSSTWMIVSLTLLFAIPALADDVTGKDQLLCTVVEATRCDLGGDCEIGPPWNWNIPQFIEVDLKSEMLSTTEASDEHRVTPIKHLERVDGQLFLQGVERGRGFTLVVTEETGMLAAAVAAEGLTVAAFGACTPMASKK